MKQGKKKENEELNKQFHPAFCEAMIEIYEKDVEPDEITLSFVREGRPDKLMKYFRQERFKITECEPGIYHVKKKEHMDMQVVVTRELGKEYAWLKALSDKLTKEDAAYLAEEAAKEKDPEGKKRIRAILDLVSMLNRKKEWMKEMIGMGAFRDLFQEEFDKKDKEIQNLSEQLQNQSEQIQNQNEQLKSEKEENTKLRQEIEQLKKQMKEQMGKIAMF